MSEREILAAIMAITYRLDVIDCATEADGERYPFLPLTSADRAALYGARDALEIELKQQQRKCRSEKY
jgi:hypothetical protein